MLNTRAILVSHRPLSVQTPPTHVLAGGRKVLGLKRPAGLAFPFFVGLLLDCFVWRI